MIKYYKLFDIMNRRELSKKELMQLADISAPTISKLVKGLPVNTDVINKICYALNVQPGDIMEYIPDQTVLPYDK